MSASNFLSSLDDAESQQLNTVNPTENGLQDSNGDTMESVELQNGEVKTTAAGPTFIESLRSPIVEVTVGAGDGLATFAAHEALLRASPFLAAAIDVLGPEDEPRRIGFEDERLDAMGSVLEFLYTGDYTPRMIGDDLEGDPTSPIDDGTELLRHGRVYILAEKLGIADLKQLAHNKVTQVNSTAKGEIEYARFVYGNTPGTDTTLRNPVAGYWGQRSHKLRHGAEDEFRALCTEFPDFAFDVLSRVLDSRERKSDEKEQRGRESNVLTTTDTPMKPPRKRNRAI